jgi:hypothetical protein
MESGYISLVELAEKLKTIQQVSFKMVLLQNKEGQWLLHILVVDVLPEALQSTSPTYCYDYDSIAFIAGILSGSDIGAWLLNKAGKIDNYNFQYVFQQDVTNVNVYWTRYHSHATTRLSKIEYPFTLYELPQSSNALGFPSGILVNDNCPFFPSVQYAISQLIYGAANPYQLREPHQAFFVSFVHDEARIKHIEVSPLLLSVDVDGTNVIGTRLQIYGPPELELDTVVSQAERIDCLLPQGMPLDVWIVLSRGNEWLDYFSLTQRWSPFGARKDDVTFSPPDMRTQIQELIAQGEGLTVEFKREIPQNHDQMLKTVAAFANGIGGVILLGVANGSGDIVGININGDITLEKDRITNMVRNIVYPDPNIRIEHADIDEKLVIAVYVDKGVSPLYGLHPNKLEVYVRRGATTFRARTEEIVAFVQAKQQEKRYPL